MAANGGATGGRTTRFALHGAGPLRAPVDGQPQPRDAGALLQSQTGSDTAAWGTLANGRSAVYEAGHVQAKFEAGGRPVEPRAGSHDLPVGDLVLRYALGAGGEKTIRFLDDRIVVAVRHPGRFTEIIPLLAAQPEEIHPGSDSAGLPGGAMRVEFGTNATPKLVPATTAVGLKRVAVLRLAAAGELTYTVRFSRSARQ